MLTSTNVYCTCTHVIACVASQWMPPPSSLLLPVYVLSVYTHYASVGEVGCVC